MLHILNLTMDPQNLISMLSSIQGKNFDLNQIMNFFSQNNNGKQNQNQNLSQILPLLSMLGGGGNGSGLASLIPMLSSVFANKQTATQQSESQKENKKIYLDENAKKISDYKIIE